MKPDPDDLETRLNEEVEQASDLQGDTIVAFCLL
jgi:hypothetical protein